MVHKYTRKEGPGRKHLNVDPKRLNQTVDASCAGKLSYLGQQEVGHQSYEDIQASNETLPRPYQTALALALLLWPLAWQECDSCCSKMPEGIEPEEME